MNERGKNALPATSVPVAQLPYFCYILSYLQTLSLRAIQALQKVQKIERNC